MKKLTQQEKLLTLLRENKESGVNSFTYHYISYRLAARVFELRKKGYNILTKDEKDGSATYILLSEPYIPKPIIPQYEFDRNGFSRRIA